MGTLGIDRTKIEHLTQRHRGRLAGQRESGGHLGIDRVALAAPAPRVRVRLVNLEDLDAVLAQVAHERSGV